ncbi:MAG: sigma 54-interacting transcriptional regulator [Desulfobacterales bacterium]|nr:sigma 54-interacting transcriptional regulator [Desulfobacterales bacterium]
MAKMSRRPDLAQFGCHRVIEPANAFPQPAWKLDNSPELNDNEMLVDVEIINVNSTSFSQIYNGVNGNPAGIEKRIMDIIRARGKLQNPITGTGGILYGRVLRIGRDYPNPHGLVPGDELITLASLSLTPLVIHSIEKMDIHSGQLTVKGLAVLFARMPLVKVAGACRNYSLELLISIMDEAGAPYQTWKLAEPGQDILIMGANGKLGLLCAFGAREKIGRNGKIIGIVNTPQSKRRLEKTKVYDQVLCCDALNTVDALEKLGSKSLPHFDLTVNCMTVSGSEMLSLVLTRDKGTIFFASLANSQKTTALTSESMGKNLNIIGYTGYIEGHAEFTTRLLTDYPELILLLTQLYKKQETRYRVLPEDFSETAKISHILKDNPEDYVFVSEQMQDALTFAVRVARYDCTTLITGESGVGKEVVADIIHKVSARNSQPFVKLNCGTIPDKLLESEMFGYEKGAFTGAGEKGKKGFFELAHNGTLFLDEVGELKMELQAKILRAIQEKQIYRLGGTRPVSVNVRIITATNRSLEEMIKKGTFREDLFYRLNVFPIRIAPLRERKKDIIPLAEHFIKKYNTEFGLNKTIAPLALAYLSSHDWPGNIRELQNIVQRMLIKAKSETISLVDTMAELDNSTQETPGDKGAGPGLKAVLNRTEYKILKASLKEQGTTRRTAEALGLSQTTLVRKLKKHGL